MYHHVGQQTEYNFVDLFLAGGEAFVFAYRGCFRKLTKTIKPTCVVAFFNLEIMPAAVFYNFTVTWIMRGARLRVGGAKAARGRTL